MPSGSPCAGVCVALVNLTTRCCLLLTLPLQPTTYDCLLSSLESCTYEQDCVVCLALWYVAQLVDPRASLSHTCDLRGSGVEVG